MFKYFLLIYLILRWLNLNPWDYLSHKDKESLYSLFREEKKYILIGLISLFFTILGVFLEILGTIYVFLLPFFKQLYQEFKNFLFRLSVISYNQLFLLYLLPLILTGAALWYRQDESWEMALKRISPELEEYIGISLFSIVIALGFFILFYDNTKNNITNRALSVFYGSPKPKRKEHWFLRFCYWLHPETYAIAKILNLVFIYVFFVYGTFYFFLGFYTFKGVCF
jgi:hypothetical protein